MGALPDWSVDEVDEQCKELDEGLAQPRVVQLLKDDRPASAFLRLASAHPHVEVLCKLGLVALHSEATCHPWCACAFGFGLQTPSTANISDWQNPMKSLAGIHVHKRPLKRSRTVL